MKLQAPAKVGETRTHHDAAAASLPSSPRLAQYISSAPAKNNCSPCLLTSQLLFQGKDKGERRENDQVSQRYTVGPSLSAEPAISLTRSLSSHPSFLPLLSRSLHTPQAGYIQPGCRYNR